METNTISFNVSKTINIGNFEAIKINYGQSITVDPTRSIEKQREELIQIIGWIVGVAFFVTGVALII